MSSADPFPELAVNAGRMYVSAVVMITLPKSLRLITVLCIVVCEKRITVKAGDEVRCMDGDNLRGQGEVYTVKNTNYFGYSELWM